jgi:hypothetical protein
MIIHLIDSGAAALRDRKAILEMEFPLSRGLLGSRAARGRPVSRQSNTGLEIRYIVTSQRIAGIQYEFGSGF